MRTTSRAEDLQTKTKVTMKVLILNCNFPLEVDDDEESDILGREFRMDDCK